MEKGLTEDKISRLSNYATDPAFNERERLALEFAEKLATDHTSLGDEFFTRMRAHFSDEETSRSGWRPDSTSDSAGSCRCSIWSGRSAKYEPRPWS